MQKRLRDQNQPLLCEMFKDPYMVPYKRGTSLLKDILIRAKRSILYRQNYLANGYRHYFRAFIINRANYFADGHRRNFCSFIIHTELPYRRSLARFLILYYSDRITTPMIIGKFWYLNHTDRITSPMIIGEILVPLYI